MKKLGMIIDFLHGEVRLNRKTLQCRIGNNEHMRIKLKKKKEELMREWWMRD